MWGGGAVTACGSNACVTSSEPGTRLQKQWLLLLLLLLL